MQHGNSPVSSCPGHTWAVGYGNDASSLHALCAGLETTGSSERCSLIVCFCSLARAGTRRAARASWLKRKNKFKGMVNREGLEPPTRCCIQKCYVVGSSSISLRPTSRFCTVFGRVLCSNLFPDSLAQRGRFRRLCRRAV